MFPHSLAPGGIGVDHWYWKAYIENYRREHKFPPDLPQYLLDAAQWYPPVFPLMMAHLPDWLFERYSHLLAIVIDLLRLILLMGMAYAISGGDMWVTFVAGGIYALAPMLVSYNVQLNPRGLAALLLDLAGGCLIWWSFFDGPVWLWPAVAFLAAVILLTHKMTTQLFWFLCLAGGGILGDWRLPALIPASMLAAMLLSRGFYWRVLVAHWDIVTFWYRNWPWLGAHPIKESPIYGEKAYESPKKFHRRGVMGLLKYAYTHFGYNPAAWLLVITCLFFPAQNELQLWLFGWLALNLLFAVATSVVPQLRCIGAGHLYHYNAVFPAALLWGDWLAVAGLTGGLVLLGALLLSLLAIGRFYLHVKQSSTIKIDAPFEEALEFLRKSERGVVMCLPAPWYDVVAYKTGQPVLYGGHGYGFKLLEPLWPRLQMPIGNVVDKYKVRYLLTESGFLPQNFLDELKSDSLNEFGKYQIYTLHLGLGN